MQKFLAIFVLMLVTCIHAWGQDVTGFHQLVPGNAPNEYTIKTEIKGLEGVDIARITYLIDDKHTYVPSPNNAFFTDRNEAHVKFYIMAVPSSGILNVELGVKIAGEGEFVFPVNFQYSRNEEKKSVNLPQLNIVNQPMLADQGGGPESETEDGLEAKIKAEEEKRLAEEQAAQEEAARQAEEEKAAQEEAARKAEEEKAAQEEAARQAEEEKAAQEEAARKAEEEKAAQEEAARKAEEEKAAQEEAVRKAEQEKAAQEEAARQAEEEKAAQEEAARKAEQEKAAQEEAARKAEQEKAAQEEAARKAEEEKAAQEAAAKKAAEENVVSSTGNYTVQILSLSKFSSSRLAQFCKEHGLSMKEIVKRNVGEWTKISVGKVSSKAAAQQLQNRLRNENNISESFIVKLP